jgi:hypothetical protein
MKRKLIFTGISIGFLLLLFTQGPKIIDYFNNPSGRDYIGTYVMEAKVEQSEPPEIVLTINSDGTGESFMMTRNLPYKGLFHWTHEFDEEYSYITCTWGNPEYIKNEETEYLISSGVIQKNQLQFSLSGIGKFKGFEPGILLTPSMSSKGLLMAIVGYKLGEDANDYKIPESKSKKSKASNSVVSENYTYNLTGCEYSVSFNTKPTLSESKSQSITFEKAEVENRNSYLRTESIVYNDLSLLKTIDEDYLFSILEQYALAEGLENPDYTYDETQLGKYAQLIGYKTFRKGGKSQITKFVMRAYYGKNSAIFLYAMCPADNWPTEEVQEFLNSIRRM